MTKINRNGFYIVRDWDGVTPTTLFKSRDKKEADKFWDKEVKRRTNK